MWITRAQGPEDLETARALVRGYFHSWGLEEIDDPDLISELEQLGTRYAPPDGCILVARMDGEPAGVVALRRQDTRSCVMKRMFVLPRFRRRGVGRCLALGLLFEAEQLGYARMLLDTPGDNARALSLYRSIGFTNTRPYMEPGHDHIHEGWAYLEVLLPPPDEQWFENIRMLLETAYLSTDNVHGQSGHSGDAARWELTRGIVADAIDRDGTFLDIGCANGLLMETVTLWCTGKGLKIEPYGVDISEKLAALARSRLSQWTKRIFVGNAWTWEPPHRFDFVASRGADYVPKHLARDFIARTLDRFVADGGRLIVHGSTSGGERVGEMVRAWGFRIAGELERRDTAGNAVSRAVLIDRP